MTRISQLPNKPTLTGYEEFAINDSGVSMKTPLFSVLAADADGWTVDLGPTWTYASATTFTVAGVDLTAQFTKGTRLKLTQATTKYFVVASSSFATNTTVTVTGGTDYTLANAGIASQFYSYMGNPRGYPGTFTFDPLWTGFTTPPTTGCVFSVNGSVCTVGLVPPDATSNATTTGFTLPMPAVSYIQAWARVENNSVYSTTPGLIDGVGATVSCYRDNLGAAWTASGLKRVLTTFSFFY